MLDDEDQLIQLAQRGDAAACAALYSRHYDAVYRYCYYRLSEAALAQDLTADVFVRMVERLETYQRRGRPLLAWLYAVARNLISDHFRSALRRADVPLHQTASLAPEDGEGMVANVHNRLEADRLARAMRYLTEDQRQVILLKFIEDLGNTEIAVILSKSEGAVKSLQHRALHTLRRALEKDP